MMTSRVLKVPSFVSLIFGCQIFVNNYLLCIDIGQCLDTESEYPNGYQWPNTTHDSGSYRLSVVLLILDGRWRQSDENKLITIY